MVSALYSLYAIALQSIRLSVYLSVTWVDQSQTVVRIMKCSLYGRPIP